MAEKFEILDSLLRFHTTPLAEIQFSSQSITVFVDKPNEERIRLKFIPYHASRLTTADCFRSWVADEPILMTVYEVLDSEWILELKHSLNEVDEGANFLDRSKHYLIPLQEDFLEVVAWDLEMV